MEAVFQTDGYVTESHFRQYGTAFQEKIYQALATDKDWAQQMHEVMEPSYFDLK